MLADPPIDKLLEKTECRYMLAVGVAKRARQLMQQSQASSDALWHGLISSEP